jgi:hypothetical protein
MINKKLGLMALLAGCAVGKIMAGDFNSYANEDVLLCFRNGGTYNLVVDAGPISTFTNASPNTRIPITQFSAAQLATAFGGVDGLDWSAFTWDNNSSTLFVTRARTSVNLQSTPWPANNTGLQSGVAQNMSTIPGGANYIYNNVSINPSTAASVIEPQPSSGYIAGIGQSYFDALFGGLSLPDFGGTFPGDPEISTPSDFDSSGTVVRSDLYRIPPGSGTHNVTYLGYLEFAPDGSMTFVLPIAVPVIKSISRSGNISTLDYTAGLYGTYTLRGTNTLDSGTAPTNWPAITTLTSGDTSVRTYLDTDSGNNKFYIITAQ